MKFKNKSAFWLLIALGLCLISGLVAGGIQNSFGNVSVTTVALETDVGTLAGYLFVPKTATETNPAPAIVTSHGYLNNKEMQDINYVELSRRGYVVFAMDAYGHGDSSVPVEGQGSEISKTTGGMLDAVEYIYNLAFVDKTRIGVTGHSMGGGYADATVSYYTTLEKEALLDGATAVEAKALNKVSAALIIGNVPAGLSDNHPYLCEIGIIAGRYDEFFIVTLGESVVNIFQNPIALQLFSLQQGTDAAIVAGTIVEGQRYINATTGYGIQLWSPWEIHPWNHFSTKTSSLVIDFFEHYLGAPNPIPATHQVWWLKEVFNLIGLVGFFLAIVPLTDLLLKTKFFASLKAKQPVAEIEQPKKKRRYVLSSVFSAFMGALLILPLFAVGYIFMVNGIWPQDTTGGIALWSLICGLLAFLAVRMGGTHFIKKSKETGTHINLKSLGKTLLLALAVVAGTFLTVFLTDWLFKTDFRIWSFAINTFSASKVWVALKYLPFFAIFYLANALAVSRSRFAGWSEKKQILVSMGWNVLGVSAFILLQYLPLLFNGMTFFGAIMSGTLAAAGALFPILVFPFVPILAIAAILNVKLYNRTGNIYLAGLVNALIITMITVAGTSFSFPY